MLNLKSAAAYMKANNEWLPEYNRGRYDGTLERNRLSFKYFLKEVPERVEMAATAA